MAAFYEMKLNLQLAKREGTWLLWSPEAEIPLAYEEELEDEAQRAQYGLNKNRA